MAKPTTRSPRRAAPKLALMVRPKHAAATRQTVAWVKTARPPAGYHGTFTGFSLTSPELSRERSYDRTLLRFTARGARAFPDGGFELSNLYAILIAADGAPIVRRSHESGRQTVIGPLTTWAHELYDEQLAAAAALVYEVETRLDVRRTILEGDLATILLDADDRRPWPLTITAQPADPLLRLSLRTAFNRGDLDVWLAGEATDLHDGHRHDLELELRDAAGTVVGTRAMSLSIGPTGLAFNDYSLRLEKSVARTVHSLALRCRSEVRAIARVGPFTIPA
jgi:hypothetical protein